MAARPWRMTYIEAAQHPARPPAQHLHPTVLTITRTPWHDSDDEAVAEALANRFVAPDVAVLVRDDDDDVLGRAHRD